MWEKVYSLSKWKVQYQRRVYLPLGESMEEKRYDWFVEF